MHGDTKFRESMGPDSYWKELAFPDRKAQSTSDIFLFKSPSFELGLRHPIFLQVTTLKNEIVLFGHNIGPLGVTAKQKDHY